MNGVKQIFFLFFFYLLLYLTVGCGIDKPNQPIKIEKTIDTISFHIGDTDTIIDTTGDTTVPVPDNFKITIERTHWAIQGTMETVEINMHNPDSGNLEIGSFDFVIKYDARVLIFQSAETGQFITDCGWEYFTYRGIVNPLDSGFTREIRITAVAETNNGSDNHPSCFTDTGSVSSQLAVLNFLVTNDRTYECAFAPIQFFWYDCSDNALSDESGNTLYLNNHIYNFEDTNTIDYSIDLAKDTSFPTYYGVNSACDTSSFQESLRAIDFVNGGIDIVCAESIDGRGDLNLNDIYNEIADIVLYADYFLYGTSVFTVNRDGQTAASDVNADGKTLTVADLVYLVRILIGDAQPYPRDIGPIDITPIYPTVTRVIKDGTLNLNKVMGAMSIVIDGDVTYELLDTNMTIRSNFDGTNTHIIMYSIEGNKFSGDFLRVLGNIVYIEFGSAEGGPVELTK